MYEFQSGETATVTCPRHVCPFAVVPFSYGRVAPLLSELQDKSHKEIVFHYRPWNGELVINSLVYNVGLKSSTRALIPAKLPKRVEIKSVIRVSDLQKLLPDAVFESPPSGEATVEGQCYSLHELVSAEPEDAAPLVLLARELKDKQVVSWPVLTRQTEVAFGAHARSSFLQALVLPLNDCGVLVILHSSCFSSCEDGNSGTREALHGMFIFLESRTIQKDTKNGQKASVIPPEILRVVPALNYAEAALENSGLPRDGEVKSLLERHIQSYETLVPRGAQASPGHSPLPEWNETSRQKMSSYFSQPCSYEFPCQKATALLSGGREQRTGDYRGPSSPEDPGPLSPAASRAEPHPQADAVDYGEDTGVSKQDRCGGAAPFSNEEDHGKPETSVARKASTTSGDVPREMVMTITSSSPSGGTGEAVICADVGTNVKPFTKAKPRRGRRRRRKRPTNPKLNKVGPTPTTKMASPAVPTRAGCEPAVRAEPGAAEDAVLREEGAEEHVPKAPSLPPPPHTSPSSEKEGGPLQFEAGPEIHRHQLRQALRPTRLQGGFWETFLRSSSRAHTWRRRQPVRS
ncbi:protein FAM208B-like [Denticeps clupeoides]|uniref:protein FAM208B-like n=1 Tax=Denticeps clupeoides TaxID=299321 RepID=UPI0010A4D5B7|nr:protein FAM208B-like [Denticeps clupeoides]XP_028823184.1 protein FAM208B-like [Denticeps clupeoides]